DDALLSLLVIVSFLTAAPTTAIYSLSLHDALPIWRWPRTPAAGRPATTTRPTGGAGPAPRRSAPAASRPRRPARRAGGTRRRPGRRRTRSSPRPATARPRAPRGPRRW